MNVSTLLGGGLQLTVRFDPTHDYGRDGGGWWARLQEDRGSILTHVIDGTQKVEAKRKRSYDALTSVAARYIPGWEPTKEQEATLADDCQAMDNNKSWVLTVQKEESVWDARVEDEEKDEDKVIGLNAHKDPAEAAIRALDRAVASLAHWI